MKTLRAMLIAHTFNLETQKDGENLSSACARIKLFLKKGRKEEGREEGNASPIGYLDEQSSVE